MAYPGIVNFLELPQLGEPARYRWTVAALAASFGVIAFLFVQTLSARPLTNIALPLLAGLGLAGALYLTALLAATVVGVPICCVSHEVDHVCSAT